MKLIVPTNWQDDILRELPLQEISGFYGQLDRDFTGGGRPSCILPAVGRAKAAAHIASIRAKGLSFNYLLNSACLGNSELTPAGRKRLRGLLDWICACGADCVTVSIPYLLEFIKVNYPCLKIYVSTQAGIKTGEEAVFWEKLGASGLTLSATDGNRDFEALRQIRSAVGCELRLIANLDCLYGCPFFRYHSAISSHASQRGHRSGGFVIDYCFLRCSLIKLKSPEHFIRSGWIRPEDKGIYAQRGINALKLVNRTMPTSRIKRIVTAYSQGRYDGNLADLFSEPSDTLRRAASSRVRNLFFFFRPFSVDLRRLYSFRDIVSRRKIFIDNRSLDGFLDFFLHSSCAHKDCGECGYCKDVAGRSVKIDPDYLKQAAGRFEAFLEEIVGGALFRTGRIR